jgi:hypothetical protein
MLEDASADDTSNGPCQRLPLDLAAGGGNELLATWPSVLHRRSCRVRTTVPLDVATTCRIRTVYGLSTAGTGQSITRRDQSARVDDPTGTAVGVHSDRLGALRS